MAVSSSTVLNILFAVLAFGTLIAIYAYIASFTGNKDTNNEINKHLAILSTVCGVLGLVYMGVTYFYFMANVSDIIPYLLVSQGLNFMLSLIAITLASIQMVQTPSST